MLMRVLMLISLMGAGCPVTYGAEIYKYQDEKGRWVFSDRKPASQAERLVYERQKKAPRPRVYSRKSDNGYELVAHNPYHAPVEYKVQSAAFDHSPHSVLVEANSGKTLVLSPTDQPYKYRWRLGDPKARPESALYRFPVRPGQSYRISQAFHGSFSHSEEPSRFAVDIAMPVGTYIAAARDGIVVWVKDDYHMGGRNSYFLDKANYVKVLHSDGTYASYVHILEGSAMVKPGDGVRAGDLLARSGSSGYSTGPHLHFVIRRNTGRATVSVPFRFADSAGTAFTPQRGMVIAGTGVLSHRGAGR